MPKQAVTSPGALSEAISKYFAEYPKLPLSKAVIAVESSAPGGTSGTVLGIALRDASIAVDPHPKTVVNPAVMMTSTKVRLLLPDLSARLKVTSIRF